VKTTILLLALALQFVSCQSSQSPDSIKVESDTDKTFYTMGIMLGSNLQRLELNDKELSALYKGLYHASKGQKPEVDAAAYQPKIQELFKERMSKVAETQKKDGDKFMEDFKKQENVKTTASGLAYQTVTEGKGAIPGAEDTVEVHYHGTLLDGTVFDSSIERGKTVSFPLNRVIKGWTEGLQLMKEGGKTKFVIPADLAYGEAGAPPKIPGGATLVFEVELFKVTKAEPAKKPAPKKK
jgi:FKBP-type peptidyl-prolyl cis-trans isomerase FkpA